MTGKLHDYQKVAVKFLDKWNNDPSNLIVFPSQAWHARHHKLNHPGNGRCSCQGIRLGEVMPNAAP